MKHKQFTKEQLSEIIGMAWCDKTAFERIYELTKLKYDDVKRLMRANLKHSSYRLWQKRIQKTQQKHEKKFQDSYE